MGSQWSQFFPPSPTIAASSSPSQGGRVFLITGGYSGIGFELAKILYAKGGKVYIAGRSEEKARQAIATIENSTPEIEGGKLEFLHIDLSDLRSIRPAVEEFESKESQLHVLFNNAGVSQPPLESVSAQGFELQLATNCLGPFLLTKLLLPVLQTTAIKSCQEGYNGIVRVIWLCSQVIELSSTRHGFTMNEIRNPPRDKAKRYTNSKTGNLFLSAETARRYGVNNGAIVSVSLNPGAALTNLFRHTPWLPWVVRPLLHRPKLAALTELYAGTSSDITVEKGGSYIIPWGRISTSLRADLVEASKVEEEGGVGRAREFWEFCNDVTREY